MNTHIISALLVGVAVTAVPLRAAAQMRCDPLHQAALGLRLDGGFDALGDASATRTLWTYGGRVSLCLGTGRREGVAGDPSRPEVVSDDFSDAWLLEVGLHAFASVIDGPAIGSALTNGSGNFDLAGSYMHELGGGAAFTGRLGVSFWSASADGAYSLDSRDLLDAAFMTGMADPWTWMRGPVVRAGTDMGGVIAGTPVSVVGGIDFGIALGDGGNLPSATSGFGVWSLDLAAQLGPVASIYVRGNVSAVVGAGYAPWGPVLVAIEPGVRIGDFATWLLSVGVNLRLTESEFGLPQGSASVVARFEIPEIVLGHFRLRRRAGN